MSADAAARRENLVDAGLRTLGSHFTVGPLAFGCWRFTGESVAEATALVETALDLGMNLVDTADVYGLDWGGSGFGANEALLGGVLATQPALRDRMVIATKGGIDPGVPYDSGATYLRRACEASLRRLQIDHIDLYQIHRPDMFAHPADVAEVLATLRDEGKIVDAGVSNHSASQLRALQAHLPFSLASTQPEFSAAQLSGLRDGSLDVAMELDLAVLAWSPLAGGRLVTGDGVRPELLAVLDRLAEREGVDRATVATAFVLCHPSTPVTILGTQNAERLRDATRALDVHLDRADVYAIVEASDGTKLP